MADRSNGTRATAAVERARHARARLHLLVLLSLIAGCTDVIGFLGLGGLFTNHVTGNLVLLAAHVVDGGTAPLARLLAVPVYLVAACAAALFAYRRGAPPAALRPMLVLHLVLMLAFLASAVAAPASPDAAATAAAGLIGVSAMAVHNALVQLALEGAPPTAMMTGNVTRFAVELADWLHGGAPAHVAAARRHATRTLPLIVAFALGCALGAALQAAAGRWALALPAALAAFAVVRSGSPSGAARSP